MDKEYSKQNQHPYTQQKKRSILITVIFYENIHHLLEVALTLHEEQNPIKLAVHTFLQSSKL